MKTLTTERDLETTDVAYLPTPEEIEAECAILREGKSKSTKNPINPLCFRMLEWARDQITALAQSENPSRDILLNATRACGWVATEGVPAPVDELDRQKWVEESLGITFRDCCDALRISTDKARYTFKRYCSLHLSREKLDMLKECSETSRRWI